MEPSSAAGQDAAASALPPELLQVLGAHLSRGELRNARLACKAWATALAVCMPAVTVALPQRGGANVFRQPLVLCSSGVLNSAQSTDYSAVPRASPRQPQQQLLPAGGDTASTPCGGSRRRSRECAAGGGGSNTRRRSATPAAAAPSPCSADKPSPFATLGGQALLGGVVDPLAAHAPAAAVAALGVLAPGPAAAGGGLQPARAIHGVVSLPPGVPGGCGGALQAPPPAAAPGQQQQCGVPPQCRQYSVPAAVVTTGGPVVAPAVIQTWSSLPSAGLRTCTSLQQLHLRLRGAPPSPADLLDLSRLCHLTHLSFRQVEPGAFDEDDEQPDTAPAPGGESRGGSGASAGTSSGASQGDTCADGSSSDSSSSRSGNGSSAGDGSSSSSGSSRCSSHRYQRLRVRAQLPGSGPPGMHLAQLGSVSDLADAAAAALEGLHLSSPASGSVSGSEHWGSAEGLLSSSCSSSWQDGCDGVASCEDDTCSCAGSDSDSASASTASQDDVRAARAPDQDAPAGATRGRRRRPRRSSKRRQLPQQAAMFRSVITPEHVAALAQLPHLSSLELAPNAGAWDAVSAAALVQLSRLTGLTRLSVTWGDAGDAAAAAAAGAALSDADAASAVHGEQLPLQRCLAGLPQLRELALNGAPVVDLGVLQRLSCLTCLTAEALRVVNSDVADAMAAASQQEAAAAAAAAAQQQQEQQQQQQAAPGPQQPAPAAAARGARRWAVMPELAHVHAVHAAADISAFLQASHTPALSHLGFVTRGPSDFARLLGQHGKLRSLHLVFAGEESWHTIAVVRLPTALPSLRGLTLEGSFWLPNSLVVALGVMEVPLERLCLRCRLAPPCLQRLQHLRCLRRLALHHVPAAPGHAAAPPPPAAPGRGSRKAAQPGAAGGDAMLQLPAKLLPPQLQELEISNGFIY